MRTLPFLALACAAAAPLAGQTPAERLRLDSLRSSFQAVTDTTALATLERARIAVARVNRDDAWLHMELGYIALRLGELTSGRDHYDGAASEFEWAAELQPTWPYAWYWLGVTELAIGEAPAIVIENIRQVLGIDALSQAAHAFARAVEADPSFSQALVDLATTALRQRIRARVDVALNALRQAAATAAGRVPEVWLMRGRLERRIGSADSVLMAFRQYIAVGGDPDVGHVEVARALAALGRGDSALAAYRMALQPPISAAGRAELRKDLRWVGQGEDLERFDALPSDSVGAWVSRFWSARDVEDARRPGDRLLEQFRRYAYATVHFGLVTPRRQFDVTIGYRDTTQTELDDRGVIFMRHGDPDQRVMGPAGDLGIQTWVYQRSAPQPNMLFHFSPILDAQDYRLIESVASQCTSGSDYCGELGRYDDIYARLQGAGTASRPNLAATERQRSRETIRTGTRSDSYQLNFRGDLRPVVSSFVMADEERQPVLHVVFAVPGGRLRPTSAGDALAYALQLRVVVYDSSDRAIAELDTLRVFRSAAALPEGAFLTEQVVVPVPPGAWRFHVVVRDVQSGFGALARARTLDVPRFDGAFAVSDIVLGREGSGLVWRRPDGSVPLNPLARFSEGGTASLYYELYGLPQGSSVATRVTLRPAQRRGFVRRLFGGGRHVDLSYTTVTDAPGRARVRQQLDLSGLPNGSYVIEIELTDPVAGRTVRRQEAFEIGGR